jgi:hypothetical protein
MDNWFKSYKLGEIFYDSFVESRYRFASPSSDYKKTDLRRWFRLHKLLSELIGLKPEDPNYLDSFVELSDVLRELTDRLGHLPSKNEFLTAWHSWEMYKDLKDPNIKGYEHGGYEVGKIRDVDYRKEKNNQTYGE